MSEKDSIEKLRQVYVTAVNEGDIKLFMSTFTSDAVVLAPGSPAVVGGDVEPWAVKNFFNLFDIKFKSEDDEVEVFNDYAYVRGRYTQNLTPKQGGDVLDLVGKYLCIAKREKGGAWRYHRLSWNLDSV